MCQHALVSHKFNSKRGTGYLQAKTLGVRLDFAPASQLEFLMGLEEACWDPSFLNK